MIYNNKEEKEYKINSFSDILDIVEGVDKYILKMDDFTFNVRLTNINVNWTKFSEQILNAGI